MITKITPPTVQQSQNPTTGNLSLPIDMLEISTYDLIIRNQFLLDVNDLVDEDIFIPDTSLLERLTQDNTYRFIDQYDEQGNHILIDIDELAVQKFTQLRDRIARRSLSFDQLSEEAQGEFMGLFKRTYDSIAFAELHQTKTILEEGISSKKYGINAAITADENLVLVSRYFAKQLEKVFDGNREQAAKAVKHLMSLNKKLTELGKQVTIPDESESVAGIFRDTPHKPVQSDISSVIVELLVHSAIDNNSSNTVRDFFQDLFAHIEVLASQARLQSDDIDSFADRMQSYSNEVHKLHTPPLVLPGSSMNPIFLAFMEVENEQRLMTRSGIVRRIPISAITEVGQQTSTTTQQRQNMTTRR